MHGGLLLFAGFVVGYAGLLHGNLEVRNLFVRLLFEILFKYRSACRYDQ